MKPHSLERTCPIVQANYAFCLHRSRLCLANWPEVVLAQSGVGLGSHYPFIFQVFSFCVLCQPCTFMPRRGRNDFPSEWVQIVRGHRPKSEQWLAPGHSARPTRSRTSSGMVHQRHPTVAPTTIEAIESNNPSHAAQGVVSTMESLRPAGFTIPSWEELIRAETQNRVPMVEEDPSQPRFGRQQEAAVAVHHTFLEGLRPLLGETEEALLRSQGGPLASVPFTSLPTLPETSFDPQPFRLLLLRRLRLPLPLSARWCRCGCPLGRGTTNQCDRGQESWGTEAIRDGAYLPKFAPESGLT